MIVTSRKESETIKKLLGDMKNLIIVGCSECAAVCRTGGSEQVREMAELLGDRNILATISIESPCDKRISMRDFRRIEEELAEAEALIVLACGSGVQAVSEVTGKRVIAALDTHFLGMVERLGKFYEKCSHCGLCILNDTSALCAVTLCPMGIRNGPCEWVHDGKCEAYDDRDCVWHLIYRRLEERGERDRFLIFHKPVDWSLSHSPREETGENQTPWK